MQITSSLPRSLPPLPKVPERGTGTHVTEPVDFVAPRTVETRLGSIPKDYETSSGSSRSTRTVNFENGHKEATNPSGRSREVWAQQPIINEQGQVEMESVSQPITIEYANPIGEGVRSGLIGAGIFGFIGLWAGVVGSILTGRPEPAFLGGLGGAAVGGAVLGTRAYQKADTEKVKLEWQLTDINSHELTAYTYRIDEDEDCTGTGKDRRCDSDYEHIFKPVIAQTKHGEYYKPTVIRYQDEKQ